MENKITMPKLVAMLALATGKQKKLCEDFIRELFSIVNEELENGGNVRIKGFGTFKLVEVEARKSVNVATGEEHMIPAHTKVLFVAAKELAARVNSPFEAFEAVEIADELPTDVLDGESEEELPLPESNVEEPTEDQLKEESRLEEAEDVATMEGYASAVADSPEIISPGTETPVVEDSLEAPVAQEADSVDDSSEEISASEVSDDREVDEPPMRSSRKRSHRFMKGFISGFVAAVVIIGIFFTLGYFLGFSLGHDKVETVGTEIPENTKENLTVNENPVADRSDSIGVTTDGAKLSSSAEGGEDVPTHPSDSIVYDTVTTTRYLTTIAKEHYGNFNLWPIIYEENKAFLGHPDRIRPGTRVVVPPLSKYNVDPKNSDQIKAIKQKGIEIYARFK